MSIHLDEITKLKLAKLAQLEAEIAEKEKLPHLHMHKWYKWSREFFDDWETKKQVLTACNQVGKSSSMIKKLIHFAVNPEMWPKAFPELMATGQKPTQIWYLYPTKDVATVEFNEKWRMFLPQVNEDDPRYGWKAKKGSYATVHSIHFNTGVTIYFKAYKQDVQALQSGTAAIVACFVAGTMVTTKRGQVPIEEVTTDDVVLTRSGWSEVEKTFSREAEVISVRLINSESTHITGTPDHKIWTENRGWVELSCLETGDLLLHSGICLQKKKKFLYLIRKCLLDTLNIKMSEQGIILDQGKANSFTLQSGSPLTGLFLKVTLFIILILIHLITSLTTFSALVGQTIQRFIKLLSGKRLNNKNTNVLNAAEYFSQGHQKKHGQDIVQKSAGEPGSEIRNKDGVKLAAKSLWQGQILRQSFALPNAQTLNKNSQSVWLSAQHAVPNILAVGHLQNIVPQSVVHLIRALQENYTILYANIVGKIIKSIEKYLCFARIAAPAQASGHQKETVYCLKSKERPEFFANNILVHNCDEELPIDLLSELQMRTNATNGFLFFVFTATLGQKFWRDVVENRTQWKDARVWQVSLFDSQEYVDGTKSMWTTDRINAAIKSCVSENEVQRRIYGRFVLDSGLMFPQFDLDRHVRKYHPLPKDWQVFAGLDYGTGGKAHPAAIAVIGVDPTYTKVRLIRFWRGDKIETTAQDIVDKYMEMVSGLDVVTAYYDYGPGGRDMGTIATRLGLPFECADKGTELGKGVVQSLLKSDSLILYESDEPAMQEILQTRRLVEEFMTATTKKDKRAMKNDDGLDALRYALSKIGFDWDAISFKHEPKAADKPRVISVDEIRRGEWVDPEDETFEIDEEMTFWQEHFEM